MTQFDLLCSGSVSITLGVLASCPANAQVVLDFNTGLPGLTPLPYSEDGFIVERSAPDDPFAIENGAGVWNQALQIVALDDAEVSSAAIIRRTNGGRFDLHSMELFVDPELFNGGWIHTSNGTIFGGIDSVEVHSSRTITANGSPVFQDIEWLRFSSGKSSFLAMQVDNIVVTPSPGTAALMAAGSLLAIRRRR